MDIQFLTSYARNHMGGDATPEAALAEIHAIVMEVAEQQAKNRSFRFGSFHQEDVLQQAVIFAMEALNKGSYDVSRPLAAFLRTHIKNRLHNFKRDNFMRSGRLRHNG